MEENAWQCKQFARTALRRVGIALVEIVCGEMDQDASLGGLLAMRRACCGLVERDHMQAAQARVLDHQSSRPCRWRQAAGPAVELSALKKEGGSERGEMRR